MKVTITGAAPDPQGLRLALRIEHEKAGWIKFDQTVLICDRLSYVDRASLLSALDHAAGRWELQQEEPLF